MIGFFPSFSIFLQVLLIFIKGFFEYVNFLNDRTVLLNLNSKETLLKHILGVLSCWIEFWNDFKASICDSIRVQKSFIYIIRNIHAPCFCFVELWLFLIGSKVMHGCHCFVKFFFLFNIGIEYVMVETETDYIAKSELALFLSLVHLDVLWR